MKNQRITVIIGTLIIISNFINCASKEKLRQIPYSKKPFKLSNKKIACISALNDNYSRTLAYKMAYYFNSRRNIKVYDPQVANQYTVKYYLTFRTAAINHPHGNIFIIRKIYSFPWYPFPPASQDAHTPASLRPSSVFCAPYLA